MRISLVGVSLLFACASSTAGSEQQGTHSSSGGGSSSGASSSGASTDAGSGDGSDETPASAGLLVDATTGLTVSVAIASAGLGDENCTRDESGGAARVGGGGSSGCAGSSSSGSTAVDAASAGTGPCGAPCDFSSIQLTLVAGNSGNATTIQIIGGSILDSTTGAELQTITAYTPLAWDGTQYIAWNETLVPATSVNASFTLSPPVWSSPTFQNSRQYRVRIVVSADKSTLTLESAVLNRTAPVQT